MRGSPRCVLTNVLDWDIVVSDFELKLCYYDYFQSNTFGKRMDRVISPVLG